MAAICRNCGADQGCPCALVDGLCASCRSKSLLVIAQPLKRMVKGLYVKLQSFI